MPPPTADPPYPIMPPLSLCAAGIWCTSTTGNEGLENSTHFCFDCRGKIHCALFCGEVLEDYMNSESCKLNVKKLSPEGRDSFHSARHHVLYICQMCIHRHEGSTTNVDVHRRMAVKE